VKFPGSSSACLVDLGSTTIPQNLLGLGTIVMMPRPPAQRNRRRAYGSHAPTEDPPPPLARMHKSKGHRAGKNFVIKDTISCSCNDNASPPPPPPPPPLARQGKAWPGRNAKDGCLTMKPARAGVETTAGIIFCFVEGKFAGPDRRDFYRPVCGHVPKTLLFKCALLPMLQAEIPEIYSVQIAPINAFNVGCMVHNGTCDFLRNMGLDMRGHL